ncbi:SH3 domain-containing protein [Pseudomonas violetae]|uniref:SH3b domain-containing protein n=1 Tax=Pseudomonas violetae TaxID=2915813 RepID=A0ABT0F803_9PSED|nr:SH3 domain-containing protein [Pseudomonas violetae]MCK1794164.1 hypothetical protein [Pseudomonas violetae]
MASLFSQFFDLFSSDRKAPTYVSDSSVLRTPETPPAQPQAPVPASTAKLQPLKNWSHPFKDKNPPLLQLTQLAKAASGYYPLGRNGLWHGGVHFDSGTAGTQEQSSVHCLADGEVVAYRIDKHSPTTAYFVNTLTVQKPFSRNFVLVRHRLEAPKIEGSTDIPPSLTFYSLYMHLQDWADYQSDPAIARPAFWPEGQTRRVKATVKDVVPGHPGQQGLNVRNQAQRGKVLALLPRGAEVTVSGEGDYRKLENTTGPDVLKSADGSLLGYLSINFLEPIAEGEYQVKGNPSLNVRAEASASSTIITTLPNGTEVTISGEGEFRKLERVNQYVHFKSLEGAREPIADRIVVLDQPIAIKAADLIGHIGLYQDSGAERPEEKLHLEVFSGDNVETFIKDSRDWADLMPATDKTWLKLAKGTTVVTHQVSFSATQPPTLSEASTPSDADLLVPKSLLDGLPAEKKIVIPATAERKACNWYRLEGLLHDANNTLLDGWVREEVGVTPTPWVNPWSWEGYDTIFNYDTPRQALASFLRAANRFSEDQLERHGALADASDKGPMKSRLYDIIDRDRDGKMTAEELQAAINLPAHAQSLSQLIIHYESEWHYKPQKWDALDEVLGHSGSTPHLNWLAEKERIKQMSWWDEVATKVGLPAHGQVYHIHPVGMSGLFARSSERQLITLAMLKKAKPSLTDAYCETILPFLNKYARLYEINTPIRVAHLLAQVGHESGFKVREENLRYTAVRMRQIFGCRNNQSGYNSSTDECIALPRLRPKLWSEPGVYAHNAVSLGSYVYANRNGNGDEASQEG